MECTLNDFEEARYERQMRLFGKKNQIRLKNSTVLISRVGGVGGTVAQYLARAGIGKLILAHGGNIVPEYLNRMQLAYEEDIGKNCTDVFFTKLKQINSSTEIICHNEYLDNESADSLAKDVDVIADGAPLFEERFAMNKAAVKHSKPMVSGAMYSLEGYVTTIVPGKTPCLKCIYPKKPDYWTNIKVFPAIGAGGPGIIGCVMAMEIIKLITDKFNVSGSLQNKMWHYDMENMTFKKFNIHKRIDCDVCA